MYFDFRTYFRLLYLFLFKREAFAGRFTVKRFIIIAGFFTFFPLTQLFNAICLLLDNLLYPGYRDIELEKPVFIVGNPRSGTTLTHRIMARDEDQFFYFKTWEIMFPAIIQKKVLSFFGRIDGLMKGVFSSCIKRVESHLFKDFNKMHKIGLFIPEEDDKVLTHIFSLFDLVFLFPCEELDWYMRFDTAVKPADRKRIMTFYRNCIKRQAYFKGGKRHFVSKNPSSSPKIDSLYEYFPGCKIIYMVRNPLDVVPSIVNMTHEIWRSMIDMQHGGYLLQDKAYETVKHFYEYPLARLEKASNESYSIVKYEDLITDPGQTIKNIYGKFDFDLSPKFQEALHEEDQKARSYTSKHVYSLKQFRLTREQIVSELHDVFDRFSFDTRENEPSEGEFEGGKIMDASKSARQEGAVLITGASSGIGRACALLLDRSGYQVFAGVRSPSAAESLKAEATERLCPVMIDVTDTQRIVDTLELVRQALGPDRGLDGLINNAGIVVAGPMEFLPLDGLRDQLEVNVIGHIAVTQAFLPLIRKGNGRIINIGSGSGRLALPFLGAYCATKFAMEAVTDTLRRELRQWNIPVSIIEPGTVETPIWDKGNSEADKLMAELPAHCSELYMSSFLAGRGVFDDARKRAVSAEAVAEVVLKALKARRPKTRYPVGIDAHMATASRFLPDRPLDGIISLVLAVMNPARKSLNQCMLSGISKCAVRLKESLSRRMR